MIVVTDVIKTVSGGIGDALEWAAKVTEYLKGSGLGPNQFLLMRPYSGDRNARLIFSGRYASLTELDERDSKNFADSGYIALIKELRKADWFLGSERNILDVIEASEKG